MSIRLFVAIAFSSDIKDRLAALCCGLNEAKWVSAANFHLTLRFIGSVNEAQVDDIVAALGSVRAPAFSVDLDGIDHFGSAHKLRTVWARVVPNPALELLAGRIEAALVR
jgi:2'-5' RNA ligase